MSDAALAWRLEAALAQAWPPLRSVPAGDWLCKMAGGVSRRANSANPLGPDARLTDPVIAAIAAAYDAAGQPAFVRIPSMLDASADARLEAEGWTVEGGTLTLTAPLAGDVGEVELLTAPSAEWRTALNRINGRGPDAAAAFDAVLAKLAVPAAFAAFAAIRREGQLVAGAFGALSDGWLCVEAVATDPGWRGQGLAGQVVSALMGWGAAQGGQGACLQVSDDNAAGRALYGRLGFSREVYRYHYRRKTQGSVGA